MARRPGARPTLARWDGPGRRHRAPLGRSGGVWDGLAGRRYLRYQSTATLARDILATAIGARADAECNGTRSSTVTDAGYSVDGDGTCGLSSSDHRGGDSATLDRHLVIPVNKGGPTKTMTLSPGAATRDAVELATHTTHHASGCTVSTANASIGAPVAIASAANLANAPVLEGKRTQHALDKATGVTLPEED